jgi:hypothetical protein
MDKNNLDDSGIINKKSSPFKKIQTRSQKVRASLSLGVTDASKGKSSFMKREADIETRKSREIGKKEGSIMDKYRAVLLRSEKNDRLLQELQSRL